MGKVRSILKTRGGPRQKTLEKVGLSGGAAPVREPMPIPSPDDAVKMLTPPRKERRPATAAARPKKERREAPANVNLADPPAAEKRGPGRPEFEATEERRRYAESAAALGATAFDLARVFACSEETVRKHFHQELETAKWKLDMSIGAALAKRAREGNIQACMFYLVRKAGWGAPERDEPGKKELAALAAKTAGHGTGWDDLLEAPPAAMPIQ